MSEILNFLAGEYQTRTPLEKAKSNGEIVTAFLRENPQIVGSLRKMERPKRQENL